MLLPEFDYHEPTTLAEACRIMARLRERARPLAGGTDLLVNMKRGLVKPAHVVFLGRIEEPGILEGDASELRLGACLKIARIAGPGTLGERFRALSPYRRPPRGRPT